MNIYVGNLARTVTDETLKELFEKFGSVKSAKIITDKFTQEPRGFGFVEMEDNDAAAKAMEELNGSEFEGNRLRINEARSQEGRPRGGGGGPRHGGGGFGGRRNDRGGSGGRRF